MPWDEEKFRESAFGGIDRLFGAGSVTKLASLQVAVVGLGGVGSWAAEAMVRSGIGHIRLIDGDEVCVTNINRQAQATADTVGMSKVEAMAEKLKSINPFLEVTEEVAFLDDRNFHDLLRPELAGVLDAIDSIKDKCILAAACREKGIPLVVSGGIGGRSDMGRFKESDLSKSHGDPLLTQMRKKLRREFAFPREGVFEIHCLFSDEKNRLLPGCESPVPGRIDCNTGYGTASWMGSAMGMGIAGILIRELVGREVKNSPQQW